MYKKGLVLEGGALRGLFTAGVMDVLMEHGVSFDGLVGVSAGAAFGCNYKSRQAGRVIRYNKRFAHEWRYCSWRSWFTTGDIFGAEYCYHYLPEHLDVFDTKTFEMNPMEFYAVCTDVQTGEAVYKRLMECDYDCYEYIRASASMPLVSRIVRVGDELLLDGGVADSIPLEFFRRQGYSRNVVVLTQPEGYRKSHNRLMPLMRVALRNYPNMISALDRRHEMYNRQLDYVARSEKQGDTLVIRPRRKLEIDHLSHSEEQMETVYQQGVEEARRRLSDIKAFLES